jgi:hypothetical protein
MGLYNVMTNLRYYLNHVSLFLNDSPFEIGISSVLCELQIGQLRACDDDPCKDSRSSMPK